MNRPRTLALLICAILSLGMNPGRAYQQVLKDQTRKTIVYRQFATALNIKAVLLTPTFREHMATERQRLLNPSEDNHKQFVERMNRDDTAFYEVVFAADSSLTNGKKFGDTDGQWMVRLTAGGEEQRLVNIERIRRPSPLHRGLYRFLDRWSELWIARFEKSTPSELIQLHVGSGYGNTTLTWGRE